MKFADFANKVKSSGFTPCWCSDSHWQIRGGNFTVNYYPHKRGGPSFYINGKASGTRRAVTLSDAIKAASGASVNGLVRRANRRSSYTKTKRKMLAANRSCYWCKAYLTHDTSTVDHFIPLAKGGSNGMDNLVLACASCNHDRADSMPAEGIKRAQHA